MTSITSICNLALSRIRSGRITSIGDGTIEADLCTLFYDPARLATLEAHPWNFAIKRVSLAEDAAYTLVFEYDNRFPLPADCLRVICTDWEYLGWSLPYRVEGRYLMTNEATVMIEYIADIEDPNQFSPTFVDCLSERLAAELAVPLTDSTAKEEASWRKYTEKLLEARHSDAVQGKPRDWIIDTWTNARI